MSENITVLNANIELLSYIQRNAQMGKETIKHLVDISGNEFFDSLLQSQFDEYSKIYDIADSKLKGMGEEAKDINALSKLSTYMMINLNTIKDKSPSHIAEMMIQGSTMGIIDITKKIKQYQSADSEFLDLARSLLEFEQRNVEECKKYL